MVEIEKGIPIPQTSRGPKKRKYPFAAMDIGDSFLLTNTKRSTIASAVHHINKISEKKFICVSVDNGVRVWRTK